MRLGHVSGPSRRSNVNLSFGKCEALRYGNSYCSSDRRHRVHRWSNSCPFAGVAARLSGAVARSDRGPDSAADRLQKSSHFLGPERAAARLSSCEVIPGDLTNPNSLNASQLNEATHVIHLASEKKLAAKRLDDVTHVLHLASNTNFRSVRGVRHTNRPGGVRLWLPFRMRRVQRASALLPSR